MAALAALGLQQAAATAAADLSQATPAAQSSPVIHVVSRSVPTSVTVAPTTTTTSPPATVPPTTVRQRPATTAAPAPPPPPSGYGCGPALAYLESHSAPGFRFECPGYSLGHQAMTCINVAGVCPGEKLIVISIPCRAAYMNEASNSYSVQGLSNAPIDPYGYCH